MSWTVVIPVRRAPAAKTRLGPDIADAGRAELARAFALDTIEAALAARTVGRVIVVGDDPSLAGSAEFLPEPTSPDRGLDVAIRHGIARAQIVPVGPADAAGGPSPVRVAVLLGDLPALRPDELDLALDAAARHPLSFISDADGAGTTFAAATVGGFEPRFGAASAERHAGAGFVELDASALPGITHDVDTVDALETALHLGVGVHTAEAVARLADRKDAS
ncbi:2-phospho-L-lactate guanylyltransferase [Agromyces salentinus]|uniref:2-phospho-L-lactate guanylyltransferase n=1 Tax=Agromyces salentinus TaxID=269421 RepID=A0ABN2MJM8_9MICO|nr:2-phospho-L-lactate guanylyltransferase [Agromyces salentinus]